MLFFWAALSQQVPALLLSSSRQTWLTLLAVLVQPARLDIHSCLVHFVRAIAPLIWTSGTVAYCLCFDRFYPQLILNWRRKSVTGLSIVRFLTHALKANRSRRLQVNEQDFLTLNPVGFLCYSVRPLPLFVPPSPLTFPAQISNLALYSSSTVRASYRARHDGHNPQVQLNDVVFAVHACVVAGLTWGQSWVYQVHFSELANEKGGRADGVSGWSAARPLPASLTLQPPHPPRPLPLPLASHTPRHDPPPLLALARPLPLLRQTLRLGSQDGTPSLGELSAEEYGRVEH